MTLYLLSVHYVEGQAPPPPDVVEEMHTGVMALNDELQEAGAWVFAGGLEEPGTSTVVREENGEVLVVDGPFPEAKEQIGGFWVIKAADRDEALDWARKATLACKGPVEMRPFQADVEA
jgi:hypothetical protein